MSEIVKVQVPIATNDPNAQPLVYNKSRSRRALQPLDAATIKAMLTDDKAYFRAEWSVAKHQWLIGDRVKDRDW